MGNAAVGSTRSGKPTRGRILARGCVVQRQARWLRERALRHAALVWRPFAARRRVAKPDIDRSDSSPRVRSVRSVTCGSAMLVYAVMAGVGSRHYSRWERRGSSGGRCPAGRSRPPDEGRVAAAAHAKREPGGAERAREACTAPCIRCSTREAPFAGHLVH